MVKSNIFVCDLKCFLFHNNNKKTKTKKILQKVVLFRREEEKNQIKNYQQENKTKNTHNLSFLVS